MSLKSRDSNPSSGRSTAEGRQTRSSTARLGLLALVTARTVVAPESEAGMQAFRWSAMLANKSQEDSLPGDVRLLREVAELTELDIIHEHADVLEGVLRGASLHDETAPQEDILPAPRGLGLCARWYEAHRAEVASRHAGNVLAIAWNGLVGVRQTRRAICDHLKVLTDLHGAFCFQIFDLSMRLRHRGERADHAWLLLKSVLPKLHPQLRGRLTESLEEETRLSTPRNHPARLSLVIFIGAWRSEQLDLTIEQQSDETRDHYRQRLLAAEAIRIHEELGEVLRAIDETGVERAGGDHLQTVVVRGTAVQLLHAVAVRGVAYATLGDGKVTLIGQKLPESGHSFEPSSERT